MQQSRQLEEMGHIRVLVRQGTKIWHMTLILCQLHKLFRDYSILLEANKSTVKLLPQPQ